MNIKESVKEELLDYINNLKNDGVLTEDNNHRRYKVGFYMKKTGEKVYRDELSPMTHKEACTFKSKMMHPSNHFLYEV